MVLWHQNPELEEVGIESTAKNLAEHHLFGEGTQQVAPRAWTPASRRRASRNENAKLSPTDKKKLAAQTDSS